MNYTSNNRNSEKGVVSLLVVIFAALLITTVTIAFTRLMIAAQQQATANDLSNSALDSAYAGIEDAKRLIADYISGACSKSQDTRQCETEERAITAKNCDTIQQVGFAGSTTDKEVNLQSTSGSGNMDQAYTCVKVDLFPKDYLGTLFQNTPQIIPLQVKDNSKISSIKIEWFTEQDAGSSSIDVPTGESLELPTIEKWPSNRPPVMRAQLVQYPQGTINLSSFGIGDSTGIFNGGENSSTLFFYPYLQGSSLSGFVFDSPRSPTPSGTRTPQKASCQKNDFSSKKWACETTIEIRPPAGLTNPGDPRISFLILNQNYVKQSSFRLTIDDGTKPFFKVQAKVDSTGRANDLFRRISVRLNLLPYSTSMAMPQGSIDSVQELCKKNPSGGGCSP